MIYDYLKATLEPVAKRNAIREYFDWLTEAEQDIKKLRKEVQKEWRYCLGCKTYVKRAEAYEDEYKGHTVLRCHGCDAIIEFPDLGVY